jgi:hypothetical protein
MTAFGLTLISIFSFPPVSELSPQNLAPCVFASARLHANEFVSPNLRRSHSQPHLFGARDGNLLCGQTAQMFYLDLPIWSCAAG